jgi:hypothetical protein
MLEQPIDNEQLVQKLKTSSNKSMEPQLSNRQLDKVQKMRKKSADQSLQWSENMESKYNAIRTLLVMDYPMFVLSRRA